MYLRLDDFLRRKERNLTHNSKCGKDFESILIAERIADFLEEAGAKYVFGVPGSTTVSLIDSISRKSKKIEFISALNENASLAMADGYARASGEFATVVLHTTPGLATSLPNLYNSFVDNVPLLVLVGDVNSKALIREPGLALDNLEELVKPVTRWSYYAKSSSDVLTAIERSGSILRSPQPGPCCIIIPEDILEQDVSEARNQSNHHHVTAREKITITPSSDQIADLVSLMDRSHWPVLIIGREISGEQAIHSLVEFSERLAIPILLESPYPAAYGMSFPQDSSCYLGLFRRESEVLKGADMIVGLGGQLFTERKFYDDDPFDNEKVKVVHIHSNPWELGKNVGTDIAIVGTPNIAAKMMNESSKKERAAENGVGLKSRRERIERIHSKKKHEREELASRPGNGIGIKPWKLVSALYKVLSKKEHDGQNFTIVDEGVVTSSYLSELFVFTEPGSLIGRSAGCLGWGANAAIGAKLALPKRKVVAFLGDGAFVFCPQGLWTAAHYKIPVTFIICNNSGYSSVELSFDGFEKRSGRKGVSHTGTEIVKPGLDLVKLAEAFGVGGVSIIKEEDLSRTFEKYASSDELELIDVHTDPNERGYEISVGQNSAWT